MEYGGQLWKPSDRAAPVVWPRRLEGFRSFLRLVFLAIRFRRHAGIRGAEIDLPAEKR